GSASLHPSVAYRVEGDRGGCASHSGADGSLAGCVLTRLGLEHLPEIHLVHLIGANSGALEGCPARVGTEVHGAHASELPGEFGEWGACVARDVGVHDLTPPEGGFVVECLCSNTRTVHRGAETNTC